MSLTNLGAPLTLGAALGKGNVKGNFGAVTSPILVYECTPTADSTVTIAASQGKAASGNLTLTTTTLDVARNVQVISTSANDTTLTATVTGTDTYAVPLVETITFTGTTAAQGLKAFKTVTTVSVNGSTAGLVGVGPGHVFGVPYRINKKGSLQAFWDATWNSGSGTTTVAVTSTATATTGDVRGTYTTATAADATRTLALWVYMDDVDSNNGLYGVDQYGG